MRTFEEHERILRLHEEGFSQTEIARTTGIPRGTVKSCIERYRTLENLYDEKNSKPKDQWRKHLLHHDYRKNYAYLLGIYLGDGYINRVRKTYRIRIFLDSRHTNIIATCQAAMQVIMPYNKVVVVKHPIHNFVYVGAFSNHWPEILPQHGKGMKHTRTIALEAWQQKIVDEFPVEFLRGLYHSDGTYIEPVTYGRVYSRYEFTNMSTDIIKLFCDTLDKLGVGWKYHPPRVVVARREDVAVLDRILGPKN